MPSSADEQILTLVQRSDGLSRVDLGELLGLPAATITSAVGRLLRRAAITQTPGEQHRTKAGRRPALMRVAGPTPLLGVVSWSREQLRGTLATFAGVELTSHQLPTTDTTLTETLTTLEQAAASADGILTEVVVAVPAPFQQGVGSPAARRAGAARGADDARPRFVASFEHDPARDWSEKLGVPVRFENDANLSALGETSAGVARGLTNVIQLRIGARSTGSGLVLNGRLHRGASGFAGELAHVHVDDDGPLCACGGRGCLAMRLGPALLEAVAAAYDEPVTFGDVLRLADEGEPGPARILRDLGRTIGRPLADLVTFLNPAAVVVDGSLGPAARFVVDGLRDQLDRYAAPVAATTVRVLVGTLGERADLFGAIELTRTEALQRPTVRLSPENS